MHNRGDVAPEGPVTVSDDKAGAVACGAGGDPDRLAPGQSVDCEVTYTATAADAAAGRIVSIATATDGTTTSESATLTLSLAPHPQLSIADATAGEGTETIEFTVTLTRSDNDPIAVTVNYATEDGTAAGGADFTAASGRLTFGAAETEKTIAVSLLDDDLDEDDEEGFRVTLSDAVNGIIATASATGTIEDNEMTSCA